MLPLNIFALSLVPFISFWSGRTGGDTIAQFICYVPLSYLCLCPCDLLLFEFTFFEFARFSRWSDFFPFWYVLIYFGNKRLWLLMCGSVGNLERALWMNEKFVCTWFFWVHATSPRSDVMGWGRFMLVHVCSWKYWDLVWFKVNNIFFCIFVVWARICHFPISDCITAKTMTISPCKSSSLFEADMLLIWKGIVKCKFQLKFLSQC